MELFPGCYRKELANGLEVLGQEEPQSKSVSLGLWFKSGSRDEKPEESGITHLLEHLLFRGTKNRSDYEITSDVDRLGGHVNGSTGKEYLLLSLRLLPESLPEGMDILTDLALNPLFRREDFDLEKDVVLEEIRSSHDDHQSESIRLLGETIWGENSGLSRPVRGTENSLTDLTRKRVKKRYKELKNPDNMMVTAAGDFEFEELVSLSKSYLGNLRSGGRVISDQKIQARKVPGSKGRINRDQRDISQLHCALGVEGLAKKDDDRFPLEMLNVILGGGMSSRLFRKIRKENGLAYQVTSSSQYFRDTGFFFIYGAMAPGGLDKFIELTRKEMEELVNKPVEDDELERAKKKTKGNLVLGLEDNRSLMGRLGITALHDDDFRSVSEVLEKIEAVSSDEIRDVAERLLSRDRFNYSLLGPKVDGFSP
ncbi:MAG: M16 family metallopeptidase [Candidatus Acetothermia bacterium]